MVWVSRIGSSLLPPVIFVWFSLMSGTNSGRPHEHTFIWPIGCRQIEAHGKYLQICWATLYNKGFISCLINFHTVIVWLITRWKSISLLSLFSTHHRRTLILYSDSMDCSLKEILIKIRNACVKKIREVEMPFLSFILAIVDFVVVILFFTGTSSVGWFSRPT